MISVIACLRVARVKEAVPGVLRIDEIEPK